MMRPRRSDPAAGGEHDNSENHKPSRSLNKKKFFYSALVAFGVIAFLLSMPLIRVTAFVSDFERQWSRGIDIDGSIPGGRVLVAGSGLAGLCAAIEACKGGSPVLLIDKADTIGGNSAYATSGINAARFAPGMAYDPVEAFVDDTLKGGMNLNDEILVSTLAKKSAAAIDFIEKYSHLTFDEIVRLGGHSHARTYRVSNPGSSKPLGKLIVESFVETLQECPGAQILTSTSLVDLDARHTNGQTWIQNVTIESNHTKITGGKSESRRLTFEVRAVILATGGFAANESLLSKYSSIPSWVGTTNRKFAAGDALKLGEKLNLKLVDLDQIQLHPTSFVSLSNPWQKQRILCPEMFRGYGGLLINKFGDRFVDELQTRKFVSQAILDQNNTIENFPPFLNSTDKKMPSPVAVLLVNQNILDKVGESANFYIKIGVLIPTGTLSHTGQWLEFPPSFEETLLSGSNFEASDQHFVAFVTPSVHYTMGGIQIDSEAHAVLSTGQIMQNLFAAGEVTGGVHGGNRLAGNGLLDSVVFGRIAGARASVCVHV